MERVCTKEDNAIFVRIGKNEKWVYLSQIHPLFLHATNIRGTHAHLITADTQKINNKTAKFNAHVKSVPPPLALLFDFWTAVSFAIWGNSCHVARKLVVVTETSSS